MYKPLSTLVLSPGDVLAWVRRNAPGPRASMPLGPVAHLLVDDSLTLADQPLGLPHPSAARARSPPGHLPPVPSGEPHVRAVVSRPSLLIGGRYWVRTSDLFGVNEARYHCANRPGARHFSALARQGGRWFRAQSGNAERSNVRRP